MKLGGGLRRWLTTGGMAILIFLMVTVALLNGCWEVAGPLIGVGAAGGVAIATKESALSSSQSASIAGQSVDSSDQHPAARFAEPQPLDHGSGPVEDSAAATPPATLPEKIAATESPSRARPLHTAQSSARSVAHFAEPQPRNRGSRVVMSASPASPSSATLPTAVVASKSRSRALQRHTYRGSTWAVARSGKPRVPDLGSGPVMIAYPSSTLPRDLSATTIVH